MSDTTLTPDEIRALLESVEVYASEFGGVGHHEERLRVAWKAHTKLETALALHEERRLEALQERALG